MNLSSSPANWNSQPGFQLPRIRIGRLKDTEPLEPWYRMVPETGTARDMPGMLKIKTRSVRALLHRADQGFMCLSRRSAALPRFGSNKKPFAWAVLSGTRSRLSIFSRAASVAEADRHCLLKRFRHSLAALLYGAGHVAPFADDDVVEDAGAYDVAGFAQAASDLDVLPSPGFGGRALPSPRLRQAGLLAWGRIAARVVAHEDDSGGGKAHNLAEDVARTKQENGKVVRGGTQSGRGAGIRGPSRVNPCA